MPSDDAREAFANTEKTFFELASEQRLAIIFQLNEKRPKRPRKGGPTLTLEPTYDFAGTEKSIEQAPEEHGKWTCLLLQTPPSGKRKAKGKISLQKVFSHVFRLGELEDGQAAF
ncbi:MAG TPA: hypothetical protein VMJ94_08250 [Nitrososphaera sp.]|nr:hypothetical protein [Nitrososphaera sp.]